MNMRSLDALRSRVNRELASGVLADVDLVSNDRGESPVVVATADQSIAVVLGALQSAGGSVNLIVGFEDSMFLTVVRVRGSVIHKRVDE